MGRIHKNGRQPGKSTTRSVGMGGKVRAGAHSAKQVERRIERQADERVAQALAEAAEERRKLDRLIARQAENPALGATLGAQYAADQAAQPEPVAESEPEPAPIPEPPKPRPPKPRPPRPRPAPEPALPRFQYEPDEGIPRPPWTVEDCRQMLRDGYTIDSVMTRTGVGHRWLKDLPIDGEGYWIG